jgi:hypothetical protein
MHSHVLHGCHAFSRHAGKLSTLPVFKDQFVAPIRLGGFSNATPGQLHIAYACAVALRDIISEHMLRRMKAQVKIFLPKKTDEVVLCRITPLQAKSPLVSHQLHVFHMLTLLPRCNIFIA